MAVISQRYAYVGHSFQPYEGQNQQRYRKSKRHFRHWLEGSTGTPSSSSYDPLDEFFSPQNDHHWVAALTSSNNVPATLHQSELNVIGPQSMSRQRAATPEIDQAILDGLMQDLHHHKTPSTVPATPSHTNDEAFVSSLLDDHPSARNELEPVQDARANLLPASGPSSSWLAEYKDNPQALVGGMSQRMYTSWNNVHRAERNVKRLRKAWPEPTSLKRLDYLPSWYKLRAVRLDRRDEDQSIRESINTRLFNGRLKWIDVDSVPTLASQLRKKSPFRVNTIHRRLEPLVVPAPRSHKQTQVAIHITDVNVYSSREGTIGRGTFLERTPFYLFWEYLMKLTLQDLRALCTSMVQRTLIKLITASSISI